MITDDSHADVVLIMVHCGGNFATTIAKGNQPFAAMVMDEMTDFQFQVVYNVLSFALASMMATTVFLMFSSFAVQA